MGSLSWRRDRWFFLAVGLLMVNGYAVFRPSDDSFSVGTEDSVEVTRFRPGPDRLVTGRQPLTWSFSRNLGTATNSHEVIGSSPLRLEPAVPGRTQWTSPNTLEFEPDIPWPECTTFKAILLPDKLGITDISTSVSREYGFSSPSLQLERAQQININPDLTGSIGLTFNATPNVEEFSRFVVLTDRYGRSINYSRELDSEQNTVLLRVPGLPDQPLELLIRPGLMPVSGTRGIENRISRKINYSEAFQLIRIETESYSYRLQSLRVHFSAHIDMSTVKKSIRITPPVDLRFSPIGRYGGGGCRLHGKFEAGKQYTISFSKSLKSKSGLHLSQTATRKVYIPEPPPTIKFNKRGTYLSSSGNLQLRFESVNVRKMNIRSERIYPNNLVYFAMRESRKLKGDYSRRRRTTHMGLSEVVATNQVQVRWQPNQPLESTLDMSRYRGAYTSGAYMVTVRPEGGFKSRRLVVVTDLGIVTKQTPTDFLVWVNSIRDATPVSNGVIRAYSASNQLLGEAVSDADGLALLPFGWSTAAGKPFIVTAETENDLSYLILEDSKTYLHGELEGRAYSPQAYDGFVYTDRGVYRPGELLHVRGVLREKTALDCPPPMPVLVRVRAPDHRVFQSSTSILSDMGAVDCEFELPRESPTGMYQLELLLPGSETVLGSTAIAVEEFVPPRIQVGLEEFPSSADAGTTFSFHVNARHYTGRTASRLPVSGRVMYRHVEFKHPSWPDYVFRNNEKLFNRQSTRLGRQTLDEDGFAEFSVTVPEKWTPSSSVRALLSASVTDVGGRNVTAFGGVTIHPFGNYVGIRNRKEGRSVPLGDVFSADIASVYPDGRPCEDGRPLAVTISMIEWNSTLKRNRDGTYKYASERQLLSAENFTLSLQNGTARLSFVPGAPGSYLLTAKDESTGASASTFFYASDNYWNHDVSLERPDQITVSLDKDRYKMGDVARLSLTTPFPGTGLLTVESDRVRMTRVFKADESSEFLDIPVTQDMTPNVYCTVTIIRPLQAAGSASPHRAVGTVSLPVDAPERRLGVQIKVAEKIRPKTTLSARISVQDHNGAGIPAEITVAAVDEGICSLTNFDTPDPLKGFSRPARYETRLSDIYSHLMPEWEPIVLGSQSETGGGSAARLNPIQADRFQPIALWSGAVETGEDGTAVVEFAVPEFSGELRLMAVAVASRQFGSAEAWVKVKRPVIVQSSFPRFAAPGDDFTLSLSFLNETESTKTGTWELAVSGPLQAGTKRGSFSLDSGGEHFAAVDMTAAESVGTGRMELRIVADQEIIEHNYELSIRPPVSHAVRANIFTLAPNAEAQVTLPATWLPGTEEYRVTCSGMPRVRLGESIDYLLRYPYGCLEQTVSSAFPLLYLSDLATAIDPERKDTIDTRQFVAAGIRRVLSMQRANGEFAYWPSRSEAYSWGTIYAGHFLVEARKADYYVPRDRLDAMLAWFAEMLSRSNDAPVDPTSPVYRNDRSLKSYAAYVLALAGRPPHTWLGRLSEEGAQLKIDSRARVAGALALADRHPEAFRILGLSEKDDPYTADIGGCLNSHASDIAVLLTALLDVNPSDIRVPVLAEDLMDTQINGRWSTTRDNAVALMALGKYARLRESRDTTVEAELSWNDGVESRAIGKTEEISVRPEFSGPPEITITNAGPGPLYCYLKSSGVPIGELELEKDSLLEVRRRLLNEEGEPLVGTEIRQGQLIVVEISVNTLGKRLDNLVIEDLLPAGLELENANLKTSQAVTWVKNDSPMPVRHVDQRDDRIVFFPGAFAGTKKVFYAARAVTTGQYIHPAVSASCMYAPAIKSVHGSGSLTVVADES